MDRKNINRGFKKLRVWQDAVIILSEDYAAPRNSNPYNEVIRF